MNVNRRHFDCSPDAVFDVLADGWSYATWVVGAARIREVDPDWPTPGSRIHHSVGLWPLLIDDTTSVTSSERPRQISLVVRAWPSGEGTVRISCRPEGTGTLVTMEEDARSGPLRVVPRPIRYALLTVRNAETLRRLAYQAENRDGSGRG